jgi:hypothetical protein
MMPTGCYKSHGSAIVFGTRARARCYEGGLAAHLHADSRAAAFCPVRQKGVVASTGALFRVGDRWHVYTVGLNGRARTVPLTIGHRNDRFAEVLGGINQGDRVVVYPSDAVHDGVRVSATAVDQS